MTRQRTPPQEAIEGGSSRALPGRQVSRREAGKAAPRSSSRNPEHPDPASPIIGLVELVHRIPAGPSRTSFRWTDGLVGTKPERASTTEFASRRIYQFRVSAILAGPDASRGDTDPAVFPLRVHVAPLLAGGPDLPPLQFRPVGPSSDFPRRRTSLGARSRGRGREASGGGSSERPPVRSAGCPGFRFGVSRAGDPFQ